jgi:hypothetical protein
MAVVQTHQPARYTNYTHTDASTEQESVEKMAKRKAFSVGKCGENVAGKVESDFLSVSHPEEEKRSTLLFPHTHIYTHIREVMSEFVFFSSIRLLHFRYFFCSLSLLCLSFFRRRKYSDVYTFMSAAHCSANCENLFMLFVFRFSCFSPFENGDGVNCRVVGIGLFRILVNRVLAQYS